MSLKFIHMLSSSECSTIINVTWKHFIFFVLITIIVIQVYTRYKKYFLYFIHDTMLTKKASSCRHTYTVTQITFNEFSAIGYY